MLDVKVETNLDRVKEVFISERSRVDIAGTPSISEIYEGAPKEGTVYLSVFLKEKHVGIITLEPTVVPGVMEAHILLKHTFKGLGYESVKQGMETIKRDLQDIKTIVLKIPTFFRAAKRIALLNGFYPLGKSNKTVKKNGLLYKVELFARGV